MIYQEEIKRILKNYYFLKHSIEVMSEKVEEIEGELDGFRGMNYEGMPTAKNKPNAKMEALILEKDNLRDKISRTNNKIVTLDGAMNKLSPGEHFIIEALYLSDHPLEMNVICDSLKLNKSKAYRLKDQAIHNLSILFYGLDAI